MQTITEAGMFTLVAMLSTQRRKIVTQHLTSVRMLLALFLVT